MYTKKFWKSAAERAAKTAAQVAILTLAVGDNIGFDVIDTNWGDVASMSVGGAILSLLTSVVSAPVGPKETPSLVKE